LIEATHYGGTCCRHRTFPADLLPYSLTPEAILAVRQHRFMSISKALRFAHSTHLSEVRNLGLKGFGTKHIGPEHRSSYWFCCNFRIDATALSETLDTSSTRKW
jgi:hypothetical protein